VTDEQLTNAGVANGRTPMGGTGSDGLASADPVGSMRITDCTLTLPGTGEILSSLDLELRCGCVTWLVGESGTGKSSLCNLLAGLSPSGAKTTGVLEMGAGGGSGDSSETQQPCVGTVGRSTDARASQRLDSGTRQRFELGTARGRRGLAKLRRSGVLAWAPQNAMDTFPPRLRLRDWFARSGFDVPDLAPFGLDGTMLEKLPHQFSGGQISRISLAGALARSPRLLVCDEPTAGLDPEQADDVVAVINEHASAVERAVLAVTHDLSALERNARSEDRVAVIFDGHIIETCSASDFLAGRGDNAYVRALAAAAPARGAHPLPVVDETRPRPWVYRDGDELRRLGEGQHTEPVGARERGSRLGEDERADTGLTWKDGGEHGAD
jgi:ABC-type glutathione transport system ATPase component